MVLERGDVRLLNDKYPEVFVTGKWRPICGHYFWDNNVGANLFCQQLGHPSGLVKGKGNTTLPSDGFRVGKCLDYNHRTDEWLKCDGGCNDLDFDFDLGGACDAYKCNAGYPSYMEIECSNESK